MIKIENTEVFGFEASIRGMRSPMNSWNKSDSYPAVNCNKCGEIEREGVCYPKEHNCSQYECFHIGDNDIKLMKQLRKAGSDHRKFMRMINVTCDITASLYWWKEYDTYKVGTVANSCSTMHKIHAKEFTLDDFSCEHLGGQPLEALKFTILVLNNAREHYLQTKDKNDWWQMIQLLPSSYNQKRTIQLNYEVLLNMYNARRNHKLDEWHTFCDWVETLPYFKEICLED